MPNSKCLAYRGPDAAHNFDPASGWCLYGCGRRDDGRLVWNVGGSVIDPGPEYTPEQLAALALTTSKANHHDEHPTLDLPIA